MTGLSLERLEGHELDVGLLVGVVEDIDDVGMLEGRYGPGFEVEASALLRILGRTP